MPSLANLQAGVICSLPTDEMKYNFIMNYWDMVSSQPNARRHLEHYRNGRGVDYVEDVTALFAANPRAALRISQLINAQIRMGATTSGSIVGRGADDDITPPIRQSDYDVTDWMNANGNIDEVNWTLVGTYDPTGQNTFILSIRDPYTWHPLEQRATQCIHQAMVRLQSAGAADYMTVGTATLTLPSPNPAPGISITDLIVLFQ